MVKKVQHFGRTAQANSEIDSFKEFRIVVELVCRWVDLGCDWLTNGERGTKTTWWRALMSP